MKAPRFGLNAQIAISLVAGIAFGLFFGEQCAILKSAGDAFIRIMQITVLPSIVIYIIAGIGSLKRSCARDMVITGAQVLFLFWALGIFFFFAMQFAFPARHVSTFFSTSELNATGDVNLLDLFIPANPFHSLAEGLVPGVVLFCLLLGFALMEENENRQILDLLSLLENAVSSVTQYLMKIVPIGIFLITANIAGTITIEHLLDLQVYFISTVVLALLFIFLVLPSMISWFSPFGYREIHSAVDEALILGFSTGNAFITIPLIVYGIWKLFGENGKEAGRAKSISQAFVPIIFAFPGLGSFPPLLFILFTSWYYQDSLNAQEQALLVLAGIPTTFGSSYLSVPFLLNLMHLPSDALELYLSSRTIDIHFIAALSTMSIFSFTTICVALLSDTPRIRAKRMLASSLGIAAVFALIIIGLNLGFAHMMANVQQGGKITADIESATSRIELSELIDSSPSKDKIDAEVYHNPADVPPAEPGDSEENDVLTRIKQRDTLRVGYNANRIPFVFFNDEGKLVGYDVEMAYDLAKFLNVSHLEFVPVTEDSLAKPLNSGFCDIIMEGAVVTPNRLNDMTFTDPYMIVHLAFVVRDEQKEKFSKLENVQKMDNLKAAVISKEAGLNPC